MFDFAGIPRDLDAITPTQKQAARRATTPIAPIISFASVNATTKRGINSHGLNPPS
jgi:hypothetical protein